MQLSCRATCTKALASGRGKSPSIGWLPNSTTLASSASFGHERRQAHLGVEQGDEAHVEAQTGSAVQRAVGVDGAVVELGLVDRRLRRLLEHRGHAGVAGVVGPPAQRMTSPPAARAYTPA